MSRHTATYGARGALYTAVFCLLLMGGGAVVMYMSAPERLDCSRAPGARASCRLARTVLGTTWHTDLGFVQGAALKVSEDTRSFGSSSNRRAYSAVIWVEYHTDAGPVASAQGHQLHDRQSLVEGLTAYLASPASSTFSAQLTADDRAYGFARWAFIGGAVIQGLWILGWLVPGLRPRAAGVRG